RLTTGVDVWCCSAVKSSSRPNRPRLFSETWRAPSMSSRMAVIPRQALQVTSRLAIPLEEVELRYSRSSGPGGQHAQKTETRVEAVFDVAGSPSLSKGQKARDGER